MSFTGDQLASLRAALEQVGAAEFAKARTALDPVVDFMASVAKTQAQADQSERVWTKRPTDRPSE